jgi:hypothetical protein
VIARNFFQAPAVLALQRCELAFILGDFFFAPLRIKQKAEKSKNDASVSLVSREESDKIKTHTCEPAEAEPRWSVVEDTPFYFLYFHLLLL